MMLDTGCWILVGGFGAGYRMRACGRSGDVKVGYGKRDG
jgi:hypothetical protein